MDLDIYRGAEVNLTIKIDDKTRLIRRLLGEDIIKSSFNSHDILDINIGDHIVYDSVKYYVNNLPNIKKNSSISFDYNITFESEYYELLKTQFMDSDGNSDFYLVGNLETFIDLIVTNMNRTHSGWSKGTCDQSNADYKLLSFSKANCMQVLQKLCDEFEGEFYFGIELKVICFTDKTGSDSGLTFQYHQGLRNIHRTTLSEKNIITRLYAFGSTKNLASDYRDHSRRLKFELITGESYLEKYITATTWAVTTAYIVGDTIEPTTPNDYIYECTTAGTSGGIEPAWGTTEGGTTEDGTVVWTCRVDPTIKYGIIEHTKIYNDIYPHREGTISAVNGGDITKLTDSGMDFNLNDYLLPGVTAKIHFNTGNLGGYEFEVSAYNNVTKEFTIIKFVDGQGYEMPNATLKPAIGDKYVLLDIELPQSYIDTAETALQAKAQDFIDDNCEPRVTYILEPDPRYFKTHVISLEVGDYITIEDTDLNIDKMVRVVELTKSVADEYKYTLKLSDHLEVQLIQRLYEDQEDIQEIIEIGEGGDIIRSWRNWKTSEELRTMVYDTDGYFDMGNIRPASVQTSMLSVGAKSSQFILKNVEIEANYLSLPSKFHASEGELIHLSIDEEIRTWTLSANDQDSLVDETAYYIYAKCTKEPGYTGQILVDEAQRKFDDDATYYYFLIGVLHSVIDGIRGISLTYGQTIINGRFIRTGKIESTDGLTYFDLDNSEIRGNIKFSAGMYYAKTFRQAAEPTEDMQTGDMWIDTDDGDKPYTYNGAIWIQAYTIINGGNIEAGSLTLVSAANDFNWGALPEKPILPPDTNLVGYWSLNEGTGTKAHDSSGNGNDGTLVNMEEEDWVKGISGKCLNFDGSDTEYLLIGSPAPAELTFTDAQPWTFYHLIYANSEAVYAGKVGYGSYFSITNNTLTFRDKNGASHIWNITIPYSNWYSIAFVADGSGHMTVFVNGVDLGTKAFEATAVSFQRFGKNYYEYGYALNGKLDELRIYNVALTPEQVKALYENPSGLTTGVNPGADVTPALPSDENLVGYWALNEGSGDKAYDGSGKGNHGTLRNMEEADWINGISGQCLNFDGLDANEYVNVPDNNSLDLTTTGSVSLWVYIDSYNSGVYPNIIRKGNVGGWPNLAYSIWIYSNYGIKFYTRSATGTNDLSIGKPSTGKWHHLVMTWDSTTLKGYVDGSLVNSMDNTHPPIANEYALRIGDNNYDGKIDEVRIYDIPLTAQEVKALYLNPSGVGVAINPAFDIVNLPATPAGAGLYATGSYLGYYDSAAWKAYIQSNGNFYFGGNASNYIQWNGSSLVLKGSVTLVNTIPNAKVDGLGSFALISSLAYGSLTGTKPPSNADVTLSAIQGELSLAGGGLVLASAGAKIRGGQTAYGVGTGFWLGDVSGTTKLSIGSSTNWLKWTGSALEIKGRLSVGVDSNEDIYFEDSGIRMYDAVSSLKKQIYWKYNTVDFARLTYDDDTAKETNLHLYAGDYSVFFTVQEDGDFGLLSTDGLKGFIGTGNALSSLMFWTGTRQLYLGVSVNAPTENNYAGEIIIKEGGAQNALHLYTTAWRAIPSNLGW